MAQHHYMTPEEQAANVASARDFLLIVGHRERARGAPDQGEQFDLVSHAQSAMTAIMVAALDLGIEPAGLVHAMGFSLGTYFAQSDCLDGGLQATGRAVAAGVKACEIMMTEPAGRA